MTVTETYINIDSDQLGRKVMVKLFLPDNQGQTPVNLLLLNDGQESDTIKLKDILEKLYENGRVAPIMAAAVCAGKDRVQEYGVAGIPDFKGRGGKATAYTKFITEELLPELKTEIGVTAFQKIAFGGFSLGGLSALDIAWNNPQLFSWAGVFSGSLWWREKGLNDGYTDDHRIMHKVVKESTSKPDLKFFFETGSQDETADRNRNGIIDSIDDTIDLIAVLEEKGYKRPHDITYLELIGGRHDMITWAAALPKFLCKAFGA